MEKDTPIYLLGYLWADGYLNHTGYNRRITISVRSDDGDYLKNLFLETGEWRVYLNPRKGHSSPQTQIYKQDIELFDFLEKSGYKTKSGSDPKAILKIIPESKRYLFWLGYFDGDGCFYVRKNGKSPVFSVASCYEQDWSSLSKLCDELGIKWKVRKRVLKLGRGSEFLVQRRADIIKIGRFIYGDGRIGLERKKQKYLSIKNYGKVSGETA